MRRIVMVLVALAMLSINALAEESVYETLIGDPLKYSGSAIDKEGDMVKIIIDWGDESQSSSTFVPSGTKVNFSHSWERPGKYNISSQAIDDTGMISEWKKVEEVTVSAPTKYLTVWLKDSNTNATIPGVVELWNGNFHIETAVFAENPLKYQLQPGNYDIIGRSPGYSIVRFNFSANRTLNTSVELALGLTKKIETPIAKASGGFGIVLGFIAILAILTRRKK